MLDFDILVLTDDITQFKLLRQQLTDINSEYNVIGPLSTLEEGRAFLSYNKDIDLIIADTELRDGLCFDALDFSSGDIPIIFISSKEDYAFKAFNYNSLAYILKPFSEDQLKKAIDNSRKLMSRSQSLRSTENSVYWPILSYAPTQVRYRKDPSHSQCILVQTVTGERRIHLSNINYASSENKSTYIHLLDGTSYPLDITLSDLDEQLDSRKYMRVNRKYILPLEQVKGVEKLPNGRLKIILFSSEDLDIIVSRDMRVKVMTWLKK